MILNPHDKPGRFVRIALEEHVARLHAICDNPNTSEDDRSDASNDNGLYRAILQELEEELAKPDPGLGEYQCWSDPADNSISLIPRHDMQVMGYQSPLSDAARLRYSIIAENWEEAMAIHHLRQGWAPYVPMDYVSKSPREGAHLAEQRRNTQASEHPEQARRILHAGELRALESIFSQSAPECRRSAS